MAMTSFPIRDRDIYNQFEELKHVISNQLILRAQISARIAEKYMMDKPLTDQSIRRIIRDQEKLVENEKLKAQLEEVKTQNNN